ncbi:MAG: hypothetical protein GF364_17535 [Candidatus Lokiarchaeota archaeon]|nr:hypothetical protein [Candidatus Lokiarchaeota archaeon]
MQSAFNPYYHYRNRAYYQRCEICDSHTYSYTPLPRCITCDQALCEACNHYGFCKEHWEELSDTQKQKIKKIDKKKTRKILKVSTVMLGAIGSFTVAMLLLLSDLVAGTIIGIIALVGVFIITASLIYYYSTLDQQIRKQKLKYLYPEKSEDEIQKKVEGPPEPKKPVPKTAAKASETDNDSDIESKIKIVRGTSL